MNSISFDLAVAASYSAAQYLSHYEGCLENDCPSQEIEEAYAMLMECYRQLIGFIIVRYSEIKEQPPVTTASNLMTYANAAGIWKDASCLSEEEQAMKQILDYLDLYCADRFYSQHRRALGTLREYLITIVRFANRTINLNSRALEDL